MYKYLQKTIRNAEQDEDVTVKKQDEDARIVVPCYITPGVLFTVTQIGFRPNKNPLPFAKTAKHACFLHILKEFWQNSILYYMHTKMMLHVTMNQ